MNKRIKPMRMVAAKARVKSSRKVVALPVLSFMQRAAAEAAGKKRP